MKTEPFTFKITIHAPPYEGSGDFPRCVHAAGKLQALFQMAFFGQNKLFMRHMAETGENPVAEHDKTYRAYCEAKLKFIESLLNFENVERPE